MNCKDCGESDLKRFYPYIKCRCRRCHYIYQRQHLNTDAVRRARYLESKHQTYLRRQRNAPEQLAEESLRARTKGRSQILRRQRERRASTGGMLYHRMVSDCRRTLGMKPTDMNMDHMKVLLYCRLTKLILSGTLTHTMAEQFANEFDISPKDTLLRSYGYRVISNIMKGIGYVNVCR
jgi:hypothetical protein